MSALRKDGHPLVYTRKMDQEQKQYPGDFTSDCSHWCLPGVPDTWNEMLSALLIQVLTIHVCVEGDCLC